MQGGHVFNFKKIRVLAYENNSRKRKLRVAVEIIKHPNTVNFKRDSEKIGVMYSNVINDV